MAKTGHSAPPGEPAEGMARDFPGGPGPRRPAAQTVAWVGLFVLALLFTLHFAQMLILPVVLAVLLNFLLKPVVRALKRLGIREGMGAAIVLLTLVGFLVIGINSLTEPASRWIAAAPQSLRQVEQKVRQLLKPLIQLKRAATQVEQMTRADDEGREPWLGELRRAEDQVGRQAAPAQVQIRRTTLTDLFLGYTKNFVIGALEMFVLLYFLLAAGDLFTQKIARNLLRAQDKKEAIEIAGEIENRVSTYLFTVTMINLAEGALVGLAMYLTGMPNPVLWGVLAGTVNFIPYLGFWFAELVITAVAFMSFDTLGQALLPPLLYLGINFLEGNFITPLVLGRRLTLNPVVIFLSIMLWGWLWGIPGALLAVPLLMTFKIFCEHIKALAPVSEFLGR